MPIDPSAIPQPHPLEWFQEAMIMQQKELWDETNALLEALVVQWQENSVETVLEASIINDQQNTDKIVKALEESAWTKIQIEWVEVASIKGDPWKDWKDWNDWKTPVRWVDYYTREEIEKIKKEMTPKKWIDYFDWKDWYIWSSWRTPIHIWRKKPQNPLIWDIWYQD